MSSSLSNLLTQHDGSLRVVGESARVDTESLDALRKRKVRELTRTLMGGTAAMRKAATKYLPKGEHEPEARYESRRMGSFLFPGYQDAVDNISSRPFQREVVVTEDAPEIVHTLRSDVDLEGSSLDVWARRAFRRGLDDGIVHCFVDWPTIAIDEDGETRVPTLLEERRLGIRPYFTLISDDDVIGWRTEMMGGDIRLTQLRIRETDLVDEGAFGEAMVERVRVYRLTSDSRVTFELYERTGGRSGQYESRTGEIPMVGIDRIPMVTWTPGYAGAHMMAVPPLLALAWKNLEHWQSASEQRNILRIARVPMMFETGVSEDERGGGSGTDQVAATVYGMLTSSNAQAKFGWVETQGKAIGAGRQDLEDLKTEMMMLGMRPLIERPGDRTATEAAIETAQSTADIKTWVHSFEDFVTGAFRLAVMWSDRTMDTLRDIEAKWPEKFVDVFDDLTISLRGERDAELLLKLSTMGKLTDRTLYEEFRRRSILSESFDADAELVMVAEETERDAFEDDPDADDPDADADDDDAAA